MKQGFEPVSQSEKNSNDLNFKALEGQKKQLDQDQQKKQLQLNMPKENGKIHPMEKTEKLKPPKPENGKNRRATNERSNLQMQAMKGNSIFKKLLSKNNKVKDHEKRKSFRAFKDKIKREDRVQGYNLIYPPFIVPVNSSIKLAWDSLIALFIFSIAILAPLEIAFSDFKVGWYNIIIFIAFIIDIVINFRTTYFNKDNEEIISSKEVAKNYLFSSWFVLDVISAFPFELFSAFLSGDWIQFIKFLKMIRLLRIGKLLKNLKSDSFKVIGEMLKYFFIFVLMIHWFTCFWYAMSKREIEAENEDRLSHNTWLPSNYRIIGDSSKLDEDEKAKVFYTEQYDKYDIYIYTFYSMIMIILGGEIAPVTTLQGFAGVTVTFLGQLAIAIIFASMSMLLLKLNAKKQKYEKTQNDLDKLLKENNIPQDIQNRTMEYFEFCWRKNVIFDNEINDFSDLSKTLQNECLVHIHKDIIQNVPLFEYLEESELLSIISKLKIQVYMPKRNLGILQVKNGKF